MGQVGVPHPSPCCKPHSAANKSVVERGDEPIQLNPCCSKGCGIGLYSSERLDTGEQGEIPRTLEGGQANPFAKEDEKLSNLFGKDETPRASPRGVDRREKKKAQALTKLEKAQECLASPRVLRKEIAESKQEQSETPRGECQMYWHLHLDEYTFNWEEERLTTKALYQTMGKLLGNKVSGEDCKKLAKKMKVYAYKKGEIIVQEGDTGNNLFIVLKGKLDVSIHDTIVATLERGTPFGEVALIQDQPRNATIKVNENSKEAQVWAVTREQFLEVFPWSDGVVGQFQGNRYLIDSLPLFTDLQNWQRDILWDRADTLYCQLHQIVLKQGDDSRCMYVVLKGTLEVLLNATFDDAGEVKGGKKVAKLERGHSFGESALLVGDKVEKATASVICRENDTFLFCISKDIFADVQEEAKKLKDKPKAVKKPSKEKTKAKRLCDHYTDAL